MLPCMAIRRGALLESNFDSSEVELVSQVEGRLQRCAPHVCLFSVGGVVYPEWGACKGFSARRFSVVLSWSNELTDAIEAAAQLPVYLAAFNRANPFCASAKPGLSRSAC